MIPSGFVTASLMVFSFLILVNGVIFPSVFSDGLAEKFANARPAPLNGFHWAAFLGTAVFLTYLIKRLLGAEPGWRSGALAGTMLGAFVALPEHLHLYAMVEATAVRQFIPLLWTAATWGFAGSLAGSVLDRAGARSKALPTTRSRS